MGKMTKDGNAKDFCPLIQETSTVVFENQRETGETGGGSNEGKVGSRSIRNTIRPEFRLERKPNQAEADSAEIQSVEADPDESRYSWKTIR